MTKISVLLWFLFCCIQGFSQKHPAIAYQLIKGTLLKGKWHYSTLQKVNSAIEFKAESIRIKDSTGTVSYRLMKDVVTKRIDNDSCIASLQTGYDKDNIRCMINIVEFYNGTKALNILYANISYSYYFKKVEE